MTLVCVNGRKSGAVVGGWAKIYAKLLLSFLSLGISATSWAQSPRCQDLFQFSPIFELAKLRQAINETGGQESVLRSRLKENFDEKLQRLLRNHPSITTTALKNPSLETSCAPKGKSWSSSRQRIRSGLKSTSKIGRSEVGHAEPCPVCGAWYLTSGSILSFRRKWQDRDHDD